MKGIEDIFNLPILLAPNNNFRYIKSRITNSNFNIGKSGCYRLYFYADLEKEHVYLLGYYPKTGKYGRADLNNAEEKYMIQLFKDEKKSGQLVEYDMTKIFREIRPVESEVIDNECDEGSGL
jgi:mRNA-degrading endonuclease RelE of RelBE toxin-antitoxin system